jgi:Fe-S cluster biosynthesis and repair protein YggX
VANDPKNPDDKPKPPPACGPVSVSDRLEQMRKDGTASAPVDGTLPYGARIVMCVKFGRPMEGLAKPPIKGEVGQRIWREVSKDAWRMWLEHSKMLINEFRLDLMSEQGQKVWMAELEKYFWGEGSQLPPDYVPQKSK